MDPAASYVPTIHVTGGKTLVLGPGRSPDDESRAHALFKEAMNLLFGPVETPPNKRLKLAGGHRSKGIGVLCPWRGTDFVQQPCAGGRVARSLSAIR